MISSLKGMHARDWVALIAISAVVAICGVCGTSYVLGEGYAIFDAVQTALLCVAATVACMLVLFFVDAAFVKLVAPRTRMRRGSGATGAATGVTSAAAGVTGAAIDAVAPTPSGGAAGAPSADKVRKKAQGKAGRRGRGKRILAKITPRWRVRSILVFSLIMFAFWLPWFIANLPGTTYWDTYYQMYMTYPENHPISIIPFHGHSDETLTDAWLTDHHPVLTTLIYGVFGQISDQLTGNWMIGVFVFVCIQTALTLIAFTSCVAFMRSRKCPLWLCFAAYIFFAIMPFVSTWAMCMVKDSMFSLFFIPYFMMLFEAVRTQGRSFCKPRTIVFFALCALMLCLTKKTGLFIVIPVTVLGAWLFRPRKIRDEWAGGDFALWADELLEAEAEAEPDEYLGGVEAELAEGPVEAELAEGPASSEASEEIWRVYARAKRPALCFLIHGFTCIVIAAIILPYIVFPLANIVPGGKQEVLGPMLQQTARFVVDNGTEEVTNDEYYAIRDIINYNTLSNLYEYDDQDPVKYNYNLDATDEELLDYLRAYVAMGIRDPESYFAAIMSVAGSYVAPVDALNIRMVTVDVKMGDDERYMLWNPSSLEPLRTGMDEAYKALCAIPVLNAPLLMVVYVLWIPAMLLYTMIRRRISCGILFIPIIVLVAFCVIAPVVDARYVIPIFDVMPLFVCFMAVLLRQKIAALRGIPQMAQKDIHHQIPRTVYVKRVRTSTI